MQIDKKIFQTVMAIIDISNNKRLGFKAKMQAILLEVIACMRTGQGSVMIVKGRKTLEVIASTNPDLIGIKQPIEEDSPSCWVVKNKRLLCVNASEKKSTFIRKFDYYKKGSFLIAPILSDNRVIGVLTVTEKIGPDRFSKQEQEILLNIAGFVISALENNRLAESLKKRKQAIQQKNIELKKLEKIRTELFHMLFHDLKGPISEVLANLDILSYKASDDNLEFVESAQASCDTLYRMIVDLLDIARMEEGALKLIHEKIEPKDLIDEAVSRLHGLAKTKGISLVQSFGVDEQKVYISGDRGILLRVLQNLLVNAVHHSPQGETIETGFKANDPDKIMFFVKDNGPGIPKEFHDAIFEKYVQVQKKKGKRYSTGLGLTFCKMAVEAHNGTIHVESDGINGSCFTFTLPLG